MSTSPGLCPVVNATTSSATTLVQSKKRKRVNIDETRNEVFPLWRDGREMWAELKRSSAESEEEPQTKKQKRGTQTVEKDLPVPSVQQQEPSTTVASALHPTPEPTSVSVSEARSSPTPASNERATVKGTSQVEQYLADQAALQLLNQTTDVAAWNAMTKMLGARAVATRNAATKILGAGDANTSTAQLKRKRSVDGSDDKTDSPKKKKQKQSEESPGSEPQWVPWGSKDPISTYTSFLTGGAHAKVPDSSASASTDAAAATNNSVLLPRSCNAMLKAVESSSMVGLAKPQHGHEEPSKIVHPLLRGPHKAQAERLEMSNQTAREKKEKHLALPASNIGGPHRSCKGVKDFCLLCNGTAEGKSRQVRGRPYSFEYPHPITYRHIKGYPRVNETMEPRSYEDLTKEMEHRLQDSTQNHWREMTKRRIPRKVQKLISRANSSDKAKSEKAYQALMKLRHDVFWTEMAWSKFLSASLDLAKESKALQAAYNEQRRKIRLHYKPESSERELCDQIDREKCKQQSKKARLENYRRLTPTSKEAFWVLWKCRDTKYLNSVIDRHDLLSAELSPPLEHTETGHLPTWMWIQYAADEALVPDIVEHLPDLAHDHRDPDIVKKAKRAPYWQFHPSDPEKIAVEHPEDPGESDPVSEINSDDVSEGPAYAALDESDVWNELSPRAKLLKKLWEHKTGDCI